MKKALLAIFAGLICLAFVSGCRTENEEDKEKITGIEFDQPNVTVKINEEKTVRVTAKSDAAKRNESIVYAAVEPGVIEIKEATNDGFIVKGIKGGGTVITAKSRLVTKYIEVVVVNDDILAQYITVAQPVIEMKEGDRVSTQVSLYGGNALDNPDFFWQLEAGKNNIGISATHNIAVISGLERGHQKIKISHPRSEFDNEILVFVRGVDEEIKYLTSQSNVLLVPNDGQYHDFDMVFINGSSGDVVNISYEVVEGGNVVEIHGSQTKCNVMGLKGGNALIRVSHPLAAADFDVRVVVYDIDTPYIVLDKTFVLLATGESVSVNALVENARNGALHKRDFTYEIYENNIKVSDEQSILDIQQTQENFFIRGLRRGTSRVVIANANAEAPREVLIVVREPDLIDDYYFTTTQNVITTQMGDDPVYLRVQLVNGTSAEANRFVWEIDDGTVAGIYAHHGVARGNRAMVNVSAFEGVLEITAKKPGTAKIKITNEHEKYLLSSVTVIVKVYPAGTFAQPPVQVGYSGLIKVPYGSPQTILLDKIPPNLTDAEIGSLDWSIEDPSIAMVYASAHSITNVVSAVNSNSTGITKMRVAAGSVGGKIEFPHESIVIAGNDVDSVSVIYVNNVYQKITEQQPLIIPVYNSKYSEENAEQWHPDQFSVWVEKPEHLYAAMIKNKLHLQGKLRGETNVIVRHPEALNGSVTLHVRVEPLAVNIDQPYYFRVPEIIGVVRGFPVTIGKAVSADSNLSTGDLRVEMIGAPESETAKIQWRSENSSAVSVMGSGSTAVITGNIANQQAKIWVSHKNNKAEERFILVYVVARTEDLKKIAIRPEKENYLLTVGQRQLIPVITNASDDQKQYLEWEVIKKPGDPDVIKLDDRERYYDSAMVEAVAAGNAEIKVWYENGSERSIVPLSIYVSVVEALSGDKVIKGPPIIALVMGESKFVSVEHLNLTQNDLNKIEWSVIAADDGGTLANIEGNGDSAYLYGLRRGVGKVKIEQKLLKYEHYATLVCAETAAELELMYVMGVDQSYHQMIVGEEKKIRLTFGTNGFPETAKQNLIWTAEHSGLSVAGRGESVTVVANEPGECKVTVTDANNPSVSFNRTIELKFLVKGIGESALEFRGYQKMIGIVVGERLDPPLELNLFNGDEEIKNYALWEHTNENDSVIRISRADNVLNIEARAVGESSVTVIYNKGQKDEARAKILVYTAADADALRTYYPVLIEKTNYLLQIGQPAVVKIETMAEKDSEHFQYISWGIENANVIETVDFYGKKQETVRGRAEGQCILTVNYNNGRGIDKVVGRIFITVVGNDVIDLTKYIVTDNIIGMIQGERKTTRIFHNLGSDVSNVVWDTLNPAVVAVTGTGEEAALTAVGLGETYVTVSYGSWLKRHILVYVCGSGPDANPKVDTYKAMNMECQYYRAGMGETIVLPVYFAPNKSAVPTLWVDKYENRVVKFNALENGAKIEVEALNEGVAVLEAVNTGLSNPSGVLRIYIEVSKKYNGAPRPVINRFLTISKTVYVINPDNAGEEINLHVSGVGYTVEELTGVVWQKTGNGNLIDIFPNGQDCTVRANLSGNTGTAELKASLLDNDVMIKIVVSRTGLMGFPYIVGQDTVRVGLGGKVNIEYDVAETDSYDKNRFRMEIMSGWNVVGENTKFEENILKIEGAESGTAILRITCVPVCSAEHYKEVMVMVTNNTSGLVYLTTRDNFSLVKIDEVKTINVEMMGLNNPGGAGYNWIIAEEDREYLELSWTGSQAQVKGKKEGAGKTVMLTVANSFVDPMFNLKIYVRVSNNYLDVVYLTTQKNIITMTAGKSVFVEAELVGGLPGEETQLIWSSVNPDFADAQGRGTQAVVFGYKEGLARIRVSHQEAINKFIEILVIVERDTTAEGIYITSPDILTEMKPGDTKQVTARLVGNGVGVGDEFGFVWEVYSGRDVVEIYGAQSATDRVFLRGLSEGEATVRVKHLSKTNFILDLKIYVQYYNKVQFGTRAVNIDNGNYEVVYVTMPPNTTTVYTAGKFRKPDGTYIDVVQLSPEITSSSGSSDAKPVPLIVTGINPGVCTVTATATTSKGVVMTDEIIVTVRAVENKLLQYILTNDSIFNMTDWKSAANRVMVSGNTVGEKANGEKFTEADDLGIVWEIESGSEYIGFDDPGTGNRGKRVSIYSKRPGTAVIRATHPDMRVTSYEKKIYVNVRQYDGNFLMNPMFTSMQIDDEASYSVTITGNITEDEYLKVNWRVGKNEKDEYGIYLKNSDNTEVTEGVIGEKASIIAREPGVYKITAEYMGRVLEGIIYVEKKKVFEVYDDSVIQIVPGHLRFIGLYHEPFAGKKDAAAGVPSTGLGIEGCFNPKAGSTRYFDIVYAGPILEEDNKTENVNFLPEIHPLRNPFTGEITNIRVREAWNKRNSLGRYPAKEEITRQGYNALLVVYAKDEEGIDKVALTYQNIQRVVTIQNSTADTFSMAGIIENGKLKEATEVRGKPSKPNENKRVTIKYNILPLSVEVTNYNNNNGCLYAPQYPNEYPAAVDPGIKVVDNIVIDYVNQTISFRLNHCGYTELIFKNEIYEQYGNFLKIPVYVYYDNIDVEWALARENNKTQLLKSRLDNIENVVYLANDDLIYLYFKNTESYYGEDLEIASVKLGDGKKVDGATEPQQRLKPNTSRFEFFPLSTKENSIDDDNFKAKYWFSKPVNGTIARDVMLQGRVDEEENLNGGLTTSLLDVEYLGELQVVYRISDGKKTKSNYNKNFLVYKEKWRYKN